MTEISGQGWPFGSIKVDLLRKSGMNCMVDLGLPLVSPPISSRSPGRTRFDRRSGGLAPGLSPDDCQRTFQLQRVIDHQEEAVFLAKRASVSEDSEGSEGHKALRAQEYTNPSRPLVNIAVGF